MVHLGFQGSVKSEIVPQVFHLVQVGLPRAVADWHRVTPSGGFRCRLSMGWCQRNSSVWEEKWVRHGVRVLPWTRPCQPCVHSIGCACHPARACVRAWWMAGGGKCLVPISPPLSVWKVPSDVKSYWS